MRDWSWNFSVPSLMGGIVPVAQVGVIAQEKLRVQVYHNELVSHMYPGYSYGSSSSTWRLSLAKSVAVQKCQESLDR